MAGNARASDGANGNGNRIQHELEAIRGDIGKLVASFGDIRAELGVLRSNQDSQKQAILTLDGAVGSIEKSKQLTLGAVSAFVGIAVALLSGLWIVIHLDFASQISPIEASSKTSEQSLQRLSARMNNTEEQLLDVSRDTLRANDSICASLAQIETQFYMRSHINNQQLEDQQRFNAQIWERVMGSRYPDQRYYPTIGEDIMPAAKSGGCK